MRSLVSRLEALERSMQPVGQVLFCIEQSPDCYSFNGKTINRAEFEAMPAKKKIIFYLVEDGNEQNNRD